MKTVQFKGPQTEKIRLKQGRIRQILLHEKHLTVHNKRKNQRNCDTKKTKNKMSTSPIDLNPDSLSSFHTLEVAFNSLKERYDRQSKRLNDLERENLNLRTSKSDLYKEVKTLTDSNLQLREKNLRLNQRLHRQSVEAVEVRDQLNSLQEDHTDSLRKLGLLQREIDEAAVSNPSLEFSASNPNVRLQRVEDDDEGRTPADSLDVDRKTRPGKSEDIQIDDIRLIVLKEDSIGTTNPSQSPKVR